MRSPRTLVLLLLSWTAVALGQETDTSQHAISYVAASTIYIDAGRDQYVEVGDTIRIFRDGKEIGTAVVIAVARLSCVARIGAQQVPFVMGDKAAIPKKASRAPVDSTFAEQVDSAETWFDQGIPPRISPQENAVSGRVVFQYTSIFAEASRFNFNQPAVSGRLNVTNLFGTGLKLTASGRTSYDAANNYSLYGKPWGLKTRAYEVSLVQDAPDEAFGYGLGRLTSRYVGGMGSFDGAQLYYRVNDFTLGILGGAQVLDQTLTFAHSGTKGSFFLNFHHGGDIFHQYDGTIAYGWQMRGRAMDRQFLYLQNSLSQGAELMIYQSSEIELGDIHNGVRRSALKLSNTYLNVSYRPIDWFSASAGYGATRGIYLFATMKGVPDSLVDRNLIQSVRASATVHVPSSAMFSADVGYGHRQGGYRDSRSISLSARDYDVMETEIDAGVRYSKAVGAFADASTVRFDLERSLWRDLTINLSYDYGNYDVALLRRAYVTHTFAADLFCRLSSVWSTSLSGEYVYDQTMTSVRIYGEVAFRF